MPGLELINAYVSIEADAGAAKKQAAKDGAIVGREFGKSMSKAIETASARSRPEIEVDADTARAQSKIAALRGKDVTVNVDADTGSAAAKLNALNTAARGSGGGMSSMLLTVGALAPALIPLGAAAVGAAAGFGAMGLAAGAGAGVVALALGPVNKATEALDAAAAAGGKSAAANKKAAEAMAALSPAARETVKIMRGQLRPAFEGWQKTAGNAFLPGFNSGLKSLAPLMQRVSPIIADLGKRLGSMAADAGAALNGPFWTKFVNFLGSKLGPWLSQAGRIAGNFGKAFAGLFMRVSPLADQFGGTIERLSAKFAKWATSGGSGAFEKFLTYAKQSLPQVISFVGAFASAFGNVTVALAPLAPLVLSLLTSFARFVAGMDPTHVRNFAIALGVMVGAYKLAKVAIAGATVVTNAHALAVKLKTIATRSDTAATNAGVLATTRQKVATVASKVATVAGTVATKAATVAQKALNLAMRLNPIGLVITALVALGAAFVLLWKKSETFRRIVTAAWNGIKAAAAAVVNWFKNTAWPVVRNVFQWIGDKALWLYRNAIKPAWNAIKSVVGAVVAWFRGTAWPILRSVFTWVGDKAKWLYNRAIKPYFGFIKSVIGGVFSWLRGTAWPIARNVFQWIGDKGRWLWDKALRPAFNKIKDGVRAVKNAFEAAKTGIGKAWDKLRGLVKKPINVVIGFANKLIGGANALIPGSGPLKKIPALATGGPVPAYAAGGTIRGPWRGPKADNVLGVSNSGMPVARVNPGEYITNVASTQRMERTYPGALDYINKTGRLPGLAGGGAVGDLPRFARGGHTWPLIWNYVQKKFPGAVRKTSDYRPGSQSIRKSSHALGTAIDIGGSVGNIKKVMSHMARYGKNMRDLIYTPLWGSKMISDGRWINAPAFLQNTHRDHGHIGLLPGRNLSGGAASGVPGAGGGGFFDWSGLLGKLGDWKKKVGSSWPAQAAIGVGSKMFDGIKSMATKAWEKLVSFVSPHVDGTGSLSSGAMKSVNEPGVRAAAKRYGWHAGAQWAALDALIQKESSWNARAANPRSSARGLFQKMTSIHGPVEATAEGQANWGLKYIKGRYGSPAAAWAFHRRNNYYSDGGQVLPLAGAYAKGTLSAKAGLGLVGENGPELVRFRGGERVYTNSESAKRVGGGLSSADVDRLVEALESASYNGTFNGNVDAAERSARMARTINRGTARSGLVTA